MGETTGIAWCDHTFNGWIGCTHVSPGCDHCYAETMDARGRWDGGKKHWGAGVARYRTSESNWAQPIRWNKAAEKAGIRRRVFCASLADVFDNEVPTYWLADLFWLIRSTPRLDWLLLTKRIGNAAKMLPHDWGTGYGNVWLGASVVNQAEADRDIPKLLATPAAVRFLSCEPLLGPLDLGCVPRPAGWVRHVDDVSDGVDPLRFVGGHIDWVIVGGESGHNARAFDLDWAYSIIEQCKTAGVACFVKQLGARPFWETEPSELSSAPLENRWPKYRDRAGADPAEWPADLRVQCFPGERA